MQNRYAGDVGDYVKLALMRALAPGQKLGIAWYLYPDEAHNADGKHVAYLGQPGEWRHLDPDLFDKLKQVISTGRSVAALQAAGFVDARYADALVDHRAQHPRERCAARSGWFDDVMRSLDGCDLIFADPDNGLIDDRSDRRRQTKFGKQMPLAEALAIARGRTAVIYHHNTRFRGGHDLEVSHWQARLGEATLAVRSTRFSGRTFFVVNPSPAIAERAHLFCERWRGHGVRFVEPLAAFAA